MRLAGFDQEDNSNNCWPPEVLLNFLAERLRIRVSKKDQAIHLEIKLPVTNGDSYWSSVSVAYLDD